MTPTSTPLDRRAWLRASIALGLATIVAPAAARGDELTMFWRTRATDGLRRAGELARAAGVSAAPDELLSDFTGTGDDALAAFLADKVRADFEADRVRYVGPWLLAETECRVLAAL